MPQWEITKIGKSAIRFKHDRAVYTFDYHQSLNFDLEKPIDQAYHEKARRVMSDTEKGVKVNDSEDRMVGHFWLRNPGLAPDKG
ncbi:MAG: hypothetical protein LBH09_01545, partial [Peptococcaceae bacterium]|nr:hypothetical protein [Peptococcaceae bacterium]